MQLLFVNIALDKIISAFSWMLIHSVWQGILLAVIVSVVLLFTKKWKAAARYNLVLLLFALLVPVAVCTFIWEWNSITASNSSTVFATGLGVRVSQLFFGNLLPVKTMLNNCNAWFTAHERWVVMFWLIVFAIKLIKTTGELFYHQQMKKRLVISPAPYWKERTMQLCATLRIDKKVVLLESIYMKIPVVLGHLKPVILMPAGLLMSLPPEQAEAILLHELAHIKRSDYLVNFLQYAAETIFFFNPAVLWVSGWLREERENCCDDMALEQTQNNIGLAEALINFKQHQLYGHAYQTAFPGKKNQLLRRVSRILGKHDTSSSVSQQLFFGVLVALLLTAATAAMLAQGKETMKAVEHKVEATTTLASIQKVNIEIPVAGKISTVQVRHSATVSTRRNTNIEKTIRAIEKVEAPIQVITEPLEPLTDQQRAKLDAEQAKRDQIQAQKDQVQAMKDQAMAKINEEQARRDEKQALLDQQQAARDQVQAKIDQEVAMKEQANVKEKQEKDRLNQLLIKKKQAEQQYKHQISL